MDPERYIATVFDGLAAADSQGACVRIAATAAGELAEVNGLCLLSAEGDDSVLALASRDPLYLCNLRSSGLYRTALSMRRAADLNSRMLWGREDWITLPTGRLRRIRVALLVPLRTAGYLAVAFFWQPGQIAAPHHGGRLELVAKALDLAARSWGKDEEHAARQRDQQRISAEVGHRLRNNLALVRSIIRRSRETAESADQFALHLEARLSALTRVQAALVTAGADGVDLEDLIRTELTASAASDRRYALLGPAVRLHDKGAALLALTIHELTTNSLKFGALGASGRLIVSWSLTSGTSPHLHLSWREDGVAIAAEAPRRRGFGHELIECTLPYQLGARTCLALSPGVISCEIHAPVETCGATAVQAQEVLRGTGSW
ncbi:MAG TPA: sensor histidine kinase [Steroidobacteraceae bacterium]|nr:sensor histidine kinase [Steroidobacteraceae bacterium]